MMTKCAKCGGREFRNVKKTLTKQIGERAFVAVVPAKQCAKCGEIYSDAQFGVLFEKLVAEHLASNGVGDGDAIRVMRRFLAMRAVELAPLLGVSEGTLSRWENGDRPADTSAVALLGQLVLDKINGVTTTIDRLTKMLGPQKLAATVRLDIVEQLERLRKDKHSSN